MLRASIFYSWQSDRASKVGRDFIQRALEEAATILLEQGIQLEIDSDTKDVPGTPPISATILKKIADCDIFLGDMTFVASTEDGKQVPNPNVMGEYGYALKAKGTERILLVMNTSFGPRDGLPFDLRHMRFPLSYEADDKISDGERRERRTQLAERLADAIAPMVRFGGTTAAEDARLAAEELLSRRWNEAGAFGAPCIVSTPRMVLRVVPFSAPEANLKARAVPPILEAFKFKSEAASPCVSDGRMWGVHGKRHSVPEKPNDEAHWALALVRPGLLEFSANLGARIDDDPTILISGCQIEALAVRMTEQLIDLAIELELSGPFLVHVAFEGMAEVDVLAQRGPVLRVRQPTIALQSRVVAISDTSIGRQLRDLLDDLWTALGHGSGSPSFPDEEWAGYNPGQGDYGFP
ncbi:hypothetical protein [Henriciella aquimarina]|uniref:hypothetical protein n=1 Tax=Henriciella aquimarina TaxID=545261 RepID=UPI00117BB58F|nr:hypothetical protein [Henriciella aquimarina]